MLKKISHIIIVLLFTLVMLKAQQVPMLTQYYINPFLYNPALVGAANSTNLFLLHRSQWIDIPGAPTSNIFTLDAAFKENKAGIGFSILNDTKGIVTQNSLNIAYSYLVKFTNKTNLRFGLSLGALQNQLDYNKIIIKTANDPYLSTQSQKRTVLNSNAGLVFTLQHFELGFAIPQLLANKINYAHTDNSRGYYQVARHYMGSAKYTFVINQEKGISLYPFALLRFLPNTPLQYDANLVFNWQHNGWIAASYKSNYAIGFNVGICLNKVLGVGYAYDYITSPLSSFAGTSHELVFTYRMIKTSKTKTIPDTIYIKAPASVPIIKAADSLYKKEMDKNLVKLIDLYFSQVEKQRTTDNDLQKIQEQLKQYKPSEVDSLMKQKQKEKSSTPEKQIGKEPLPETIKTGSTQEFIDSKGNKTTKGYYIIVGSFMNKDGAEKERQNFINKGYEASSIIFNEKNRFTYVYIAKVNTREEAVNVLKAAKTKGATEAWIQILE